VRTYDSGSKFILKWEITVTCYSVVVRSPWNMPFLLFKKRVWEHEA
jgi:hypothetical protein